MPPAIDHLDLVVSSIERSLPFYRDLLRPLGWKQRREVPGERGETIHYLWGPGLRSSLGVREVQSEAHPTPLRPLRGRSPPRGLRGSLATGRRRRAAWLRRRGAEIESGPEEYDYTPRYYAVFFYDPDGIKLETVHRPRWRALVRR